MNERGILGNEGEDLAAAFLERSGLEILERNHRCKAGEIDIVARDGSTLVFCEVKTRRTSRWGEPYEAVDFRKRARIRRLAALWLSERNPGAGSVRFDVVSITLGSGSPEIDHFAGVF